MKGKLQRRRKRVAKGIYRDRWGLSASVRGGGLRREKRFPADTSIKEIQRWRQETRVALRAAGHHAGSGTFAEDAGTYLLTVKAMPTFGEREAHIRLWIAEFGSRRRASIETHEIDEVLNRWMAAGLAASTVKHRRTALLHLFNRLDGEGARNPVRRSFVPQEPDPEPRGLSYETVRAILDAMPDRGRSVKGRARDDVSKTKARLAVIAYTGLPPASIMRLRPQDVRWEAGTVFVLGRRKGKRTKARTMPLTPMGLNALREFDAADCWGPFSTSSVWKSFQRACAKLGLTGLRPYDFRHAFGSAAYAATGDLRAAQQLLGHATLKMTDRYTLAAVPGRLRVAVGQLEAIQQVPAAKKVAETGGSTRPVLVSS